MIVFTVMYPHIENHKFDYEYYETHHIPLVLKKLGPACKRCIRQKGLAGGDPGSKPPYVMLANLYFDSIESMQNSLAPIRGDLMNDLVNFTNIKPEILISEEITSD